MWELVVHNKHTVLCSSVMLIPEELGASAGNTNTIMAGRTGNNTSLVGHTPTPTRVPAEHANNTIIAGNTNKRWAIAAAVYVFELVESRVHTQSFVLHKIMRHCHRKLRTSV